MAEGFGGALVKFNAAKERHWRPSTKAVTYGALAVLGVGGLAASAVMGNPVLTAAAAGTLYRAGKGAWQAYKESNKIPFDDMAKSAGISPSGVWKELGRDAARGRPDSALTDYHSGASEALLRAQSDDEEPPGLVEISGWSDDRREGYERVVQIGRYDSDLNAPKNARDFVSGMREELEARHSSPSVVAPPRPLSGGVVGGAAAQRGAGVVGLRHSLQALILQAEPVLSSLTHTERASDDLRGRFLQELESSASGRDVLDVLDGATAAVEEAVRHVGQAIARTEGFIENLSN